MSSQNNPHKRLGHHFFIAMWFVALILLFILFDNLLEQDYNPNQIVDSSESEYGERVVVLKRNRFGHYVTTGKINNQTVTFILDTGATDIAVPGKIAKQLKLHYGPESYYQTANGTIIGYRTQLNSVSIGTIQLHDIRASINPQMKHDEILLGMSFLKHIEFTQRGDTLILRQ